MVPEKNSRQMGKHAVGISKIIHFVSQKMINLKDYTNNKRVYSELHQKLPNNLVDFKNWYWIILKQQICVLIKATIMLWHRTIIGTGITWKKILLSLYMCNSACRWLIIENAEIFPSYVKHFWIFSHEKNCRILIGKDK